MADYDRTAVIDRFLAGVSPEPNSGCWLWTGTATRAGYGEISVRSIQHNRLLAHRLSHELFIGPIPTNFDVDHLCRNSYCVNLRHLEAVTHGENMRRGLIWKRNSEVAASKTHCANGHPYDEKNLIFQKNSFGKIIGRKCRTCCDAIRLARREKTNARERARYVAKQNANGMIVKECPSGRHPRKSTSPKTTKSAAGF